MDALALSGYERMADVIWTSQADAGEWQRQGEVREGALDSFGIPVFATLHGYADLAATGMLTPEAAEHGLDEVIAFILRGCAPDSRP